MDSHSGHSIGKRGIFSNVKQKIFWPPALLVMALLIIGIVDSEGFLNGANAALAFAVGRFGWMYCLFVFLFLVFVVFVAFSPIGDVKLGGEKAKPILSYWNWWAIALCAGIGSGIVFWGVAEPLYHYHTPPSLYGGDPETTAAALDSMKISILHWSFHPYAIFSVFGLAIAYSHYELKQPLKASTALYPIFGTRLQGSFGQFIDALCIFATVGCVITSTGFGTLQITGGMEYLLGIPQSDAMYVLVVCGLTLLFAFSSYTGLQKGIRFFSSHNAKLFIFLLVFIFFTGPTTYFLNLGTESFGGFLGDLLKISLWTDSFQEGSNWVGSWTVFFWAWWLTFAPILGVFLAKIAYGRTIREFLVVNVLAPASFSVLWIILFGGGAIAMDMETGGALWSVINTKGVEHTIYEFLKGYPLSALTMPIALLVVAISLITLVDSGVSAIAEICTREVTTANGEPPAGMKLFWALLVGSMAILFLLIAGVAATTALQTTSIVTGLPILVIELFSMFGLMKAFRERRLRRRQRQIDVEVKQKAALSEPVVTLRKTADSTESLM
ncbi:MAG: BCCT family transporter [Desulfovibrio sp.]